MGNMKRREFLHNVSALSVGAYAGYSMMVPAMGDFVTDDKYLPNITHGVSSGDVSQDKAVIWSRSDRPAKMIVDVASNESFKNAKRFYGPEVLENSDFTGKTYLRGLEPGQSLFYRVQFQDLSDIKRFSAPIIGRFKTAPAEKTSVRFGWSGDTAGQGFGIDESRGGMKTYATMMGRELDFFVHSGDVCYADGPFSSEVALDDGSKWKNLTTESTSKVAESLDEFRGNFRYNLLDKNVRQFNANVPVFAQWDDHETTNNWYPGEQLTGDDRYTVKSASLLAARGKRAFFEYMPIGHDNNLRICRTISRGPLLELFFLDLRTYRGKNTSNRQTEKSSETRFLGDWQLGWLKKALLNCKSTWKFICSDMPIGLMVSDGKNFENCANGDGPALGRELEIAELLKFIKDNNLKNIVFITADVHYAASHYYDPNKAQFQEFNPFWEFVSGPLHAGTFGPGRLDNTFGPEQVFCSLPKGMKQNRPPSEDLQFFGVVEIDGETETCRVTHVNRKGESLWSRELPPA